MKNEIISELNSGSLYITSDVIESIVVVEIDQIDNVSLLDYHVMDRFSQNETSKPIIVKMEDSDIYIDIKISVDYGIDIIKKCEEIQDKIIEKISNMIGSNIIEINIRVKDMNYTKEERLNG